MSRRPTIRSEPTGRTRSKDRFTPVPANGAAWPSRILLSGDHARIEQWRRDQSEVVPARIAPTWLLIPPGGSPAGLACAAAVRYTRGRDNRPGPPRGVGPARRGKQRPIRGRPVAPARANTNAQARLHRRVLLRTDLPDFRPGDTVKVHVKVIEARSRIQVFQGVVLSRAGDRLRETFTVRKVSFGTGVERRFPVHSPIIDKIEIVSRGDVRRASCTTCATAAARPPRFAKRENA